MTNNKSKTTIKKITTKLLMCMLMLTMLVAVVPITTHAASSKLKLFCTQAEIKNNKCTISKYNKSRLLACYKGTELIENQYLDCKWKSSKTKVATVDEWGIITPKKNGTTTITCKYKNQTAKVQITVKNINLVGEWTHKRIIGDYCIYPKLYYKGKEVPSKEYTVKSSNPKVVRIYSGYYIMGYGKGTAYVTYTYKGKSVKGKITVVNNRTNFSWWEK